MKLYKSKKEPEVYHYLNKKNDKLWLYRHKYYDVLGKRKEKKRSGFTTEKEAIKALLEIKAQLLNGNHIQVEHSSLTIGQWLDTWYEMNEKNWKVTSRKQREMAIRLQMKPLLGHYKLQTLDKVTYQREYINALEKKYKPSTVKLLHNLFKIAINAAVDAEIITRNRFTKVIFKENVASDESSNVANFLSPHQLVQFLDVAKEDNITIYTFLLVVAYSGVRRGEAAGLMWKNIDFDNNTITIERTRDNKGTRSPKTRNSYRKILMDPSVMAQLKLYRKWCIEKRLAYALPFNEETYTFISYQTAEPITDSALLYGFRRALKKANITANITLHGLRHTHCTILLNQGMNIKVIAERLGNTPQMIYDIYGHVLKEVEQQSVDIFSRSLKAIGADFGANN